MKTEATVANEGAGGERSITRLWQGQPEQDQGTPPPCPTSPLSNSLGRAWGGLPSLSWGTPNQGVGKCHSQPSTPADQRARVGNGLMSAEHEQAKVSSHLAEYCSLACKWFLFVLTLSYSIRCILSATLNLC